MINAKKFNNGILNMIKIHSYEFYIIERVLDVQCTCITAATDQADINCPKCLGTGYKIRIRKTKGASQETKLPPTFNSDNFLVARNYFIPTNSSKLQEGDIIVEEDSVYVIFEFQKMLSIEGTLPYIKYSATKKKFDQDSFFKNFNNIVRRKSK